MKKVILLVSPCVMIVLFLMLASCGDQLKTDNPPSGAITDIDGNVYHAVTIGSQIWMVENLKVTKYRNSDPIQNATTSNLWLNLVNGAYAWYDNDSKNKSLYGALYNWYAIKDIRNIAPVGWHVATDSDWTILTTYIGGESLAGGKLKETGLTHWSSPNTGATNQYGFTALPGGIISGGISDGIGAEGVWWSYIITTPTDYSHNWHREMWLDEVTVDKSGYIFQNGLGFSVRCVKD